jgi:hypothetical protein
VRRGDLQPKALPTPARAPEPPPDYDPELHAQMQRDIARLRHTIWRSIPETGPGQKLRQRRVPSFLTAEGTTCARDPAYLAQIQERKAMLQAQTALLQIQGPSLEAANHVRVLFTSVGNEADRVGPS